MKKLRQLLSIMTVVVFLIALLSAFIPVSAVQVPETLKIYVGYWGGPYAVKAEFTRDQLKRMTQYESYYTYITRVGTVKLQYAKGPTLKTILNASGIDINSIRQFDFYTVDSEAKFLSKGRSELLDTTRYYYPNLRANGYTDSNNQEWVVTDPAAAKIGAKVVPVIIATDECSTNHPAETPLPSQMTSAESFRLCSGQTDLTSVTSFESAKWIHAIYVVLSGSPPEGIKINEGDLLNLKVGSTQKLTYTLLGNDIADSEKNVTWQSSNPNIIKVDNQGRITVLAQGEAVITATTSNGKTASIKINVEKDKEDKTKDDTVPHGTKKPEKKDNRPQKVIPDFSHSQGNLDISQDKVKADKKKVEAVNVSTLSQLVISELDVTGESSVLWRKEDMDPDALELGKLENDNRQGKLFAGTSAGVCFVIGLGFRIKRFFGDI